MGRHKLSPEKKRILIGASIEKKIVDAIGLLQCKEIAEEAVNNKYSEIYSDRYRNIKKEENYMSLLKSGMFWEFHPELTGKWYLDKPVIDGR